MQKNGKFMGGQASKQKACAFCHSPKHQGYITVKMLKQHECNAKHCKYLEPFEDHPYWVRRAEIKAIKQAKKDAERGNLSLMAV